MKKKYKEKLCTSTRKDYKFIQSIQSLKRWHQILTAKKTTGKTLNEYKMNAIGQVYYYKNTKNIPNFHTQKITSLNETKT